MNKVIWALGVSTLGSVFFLGTLVGWSVAKADTPGAKNNRPVGDIHKDLKAFMKRSKSDDSTEKCAAVYDLCALHREIVMDARFRQNHVLQSYRSIARDRLKRCLRDYEIAESRAQRKAKKRNRKGADDQNDILMMDRELEKLGPDYVIAETLSEHLHAIGQVTGGPSQVFTYANGNFGPGSAQDLIRLIETTIDPDSWEVNGGNGRMFFYRPACALVVSASADVQDRMGDLLRNLRRLDR